MKKNLILLFAIGSFFLLSSVGIVENNKYIKNKTEQLYTVNDEINNLENKAIIQKGIDLDNSKVIVNEVVEEEKGTIAAFIGAIVIRFFQILFNAFNDLIKS